MCRKYNAPPRRQNFFGLQDGAGWSALGWLSLQTGFLPVISPIVLGEDGGGLNCNADDAARAVAEALGAQKLVFLTDVGGILIDSHNTKTAVPHMDVKRALELMDENGRKTIGKTKTKPPS